MKKKNLTLLVFLNVSVIGAITLLTIGLLWIDAIRDRYAAESEQLREFHTIRVKDELKNRVDTLVNFVEYRRKTTEKLLKRELRDRVYEVRSLIEHLYTSNRDSMPEADLKNLIRESIRGLRFNDGRGYYFIDSLEGDVVLYPVNPKSEGTNLYNLQDERGNYILQDEINLVKLQKEGYIEGYWKKPGISEGDYKKIAYVHVFEPYNWYFGTGEYVDEVTRQVQEEITAYINQLIYGKSGDQYVFIHDYEGTELANGLFRHLVGSNNFSLQDLQGTEIVKEQVKLAKTPPHNGYLTHYWLKPGGSGEEEKLTYIASVPDWQWVIGSGARMNALREAIAENDKELQVKLRESINNIILMMLVIFTGSLIMAKFMANSISKNIYAISRHLEKDS